MNRPIEVLVVEHHPGMRRSLHASLDAEDGIHVAGATGDAMTGLSLAGRRGVSVAILDTGVATLASPSGADVLSRLARRVPVIVAGMGDPELYAGPYIAAGASGYWAKYDDLATLVDLLRTVAAPRRAAA
jgi:DNA-binding NarL/FixJ family response regulator